MIKDSGVYKLSDPETGMYYIGSTGNMQQRLAQHLSDFKKGRHHSFKDRKELGGQVDWQLEMVYVVVDRAEAYALEEALLTQSKDDPKLLNRSLSAKGLRFRPDSPDNQKRIDLMTESLVRKYEAMSPEERKRIYGNVGEANGMYGRNHTDAVKEFISRVNRGNSYAKGAVRSAEQRARLSDMAKQRRGEANPFFGKQHTDETKRKLSENRKANPIKPPNMRSIKIGDSVFESLNEASRQTDISAPLLIHRLKSANAKYAGYQYI